MVSAVQFRVPPPRISCLRHNYTHIYFCPQRFSANLQPTNHTVPAVTAHPWLPYVGETDTQSPGSIESALRIQWKGRPAVRLWRIPSVGCERARVPGVLSCFGRMSYSEEALGPLKSWESLGMKVNTC